MATQLPAGLPQTEFPHSSECPVWKADKTFHLDWMQSDWDPNLYERVCQCGRESHRLRPAEKRPPKPDLSQHHHGDVGDWRLGNLRPCSAEAELTFSGYGPNGRWESRCRACGSYQFYLPPAVGSSAEAAMPPVDYKIPDFLALAEGREKAQKAYKRAEILDALGLDEDDLEALLAVTRSMVKQPKAKAL